MTKPVRIAIVGDFNERFPPHTTTNDAVGHAAAHLGLPVEHLWIGTCEIAQRGAERLYDFHGVWISPGSPYRNAEGAFAAIQFARMRGWPLFST